MTDKPKKSPKTPLLAKSLYIKNCQWYCFMLLIQQIRVPKLNSVKKWGRQVKHFLSYSAQTSVLIFVAGPGRAGPGRAGSGRVRTYFTQNEKICRYISENGLYDDYLVVYEKLMKSHIHAEGTSLTLRVGTFGAYAPLRS